MIKWDNRIKAKSFKSYYIQRCIETAKITYKKLNILRKRLSEFLEDPTNWMIVSDNVTKSLKYRKSIGLFGDIFDTEEKHILDVNMSLGELKDSLENLLDIPEYLNYFSRIQKKKIPDNRIIRYHVESYLNQNYVFLQRLTRYCNLMRKHLKKKKEFEKIKIIDESLNYMRNIMSELVKKRGFHVHEKEFLDVYLANLKISSIAKEFGLKESKQERKLAVCMPRVVWTQKMKESNDILIGALDNIFKSFAQHGVH